MENGANGESQLANGNKNGTILQTNSQNHTTAKQIDSPKFEISTNWPVGNQKKIRDCVSMIPKAEAPEWYRDQHYILCSF